MPGGGGGCERLFEEFPEIHYFWWGQVSFSFVTIFSLLTDTEISPESSSDIINNEKSSSPIAQGPHSLCKLLCRQLKIPEQ